jgi:predicted RNA-binding Zn ribbon-like protein
MNDKKDFSHLRLDGGNLSLDFINTISDRFEDPLYDHLSSYSDLLFWAEYAGGIKEHQKKQLLNMRLKNQEKAEKVFGQAQELREAMYRYVDSMIKHERVPNADAQLINEWLADAFSQLALVQSGGEISLDWKNEEMRLEHVLRPIIRSFAELVTSDFRRRVKKCPNCGWVFVDQSKNNSRRWCSMETCGNRVKVQRHAKKGHKSNK